MLEIPGFTYPVEEFYLEDVIAMTRFAIFINSLIFFKHKTTIFQYGRYHFQDSQQNLKIWQRKKNAKRTQKKQNEFEEFIEPYLRHLQYTVRILDDRLKTLFKRKSSIIKFSVFLYRESIQNSCWKNCKIQRARRYPMSSFVN